MSIQKPSIPKGTRDFGPSQMAKRNYIFRHIRSTFEKFGFMPLETPTMENLSVLTGKYGEEGDQLLFKILNSGDFLKDVPEDKLKKDNAKALTFDIAEKGLRYDLTVPFARYVVMNQHEITFPFKRYQIQPVWRADRPQKGRYREFYQCDADVVGTDSLLCEAEIVLMIHEVFEKLQLSDYAIKINNRKILTAITEYIGAAGKESEFCVAIDKLDKIGLEKVNEELAQRGFSSEAIQKAQPFIVLKGTNEEKLSSLQATLGQLPSGEAGLSELQRVFDYLKAFGVSIPQVDFDITLARGLSYYTGAIFEVKVNNVSIGSVSGGGRYDNLTGVFGLPGVSGVGFSFGVDRLYDVLEELNLFPSEAHTSTQILIANFDSDSERFALPLLKKLREAGIRAEIFPESAKMKKQMNYADKKQIPFVLMAGPDEIASGQLGFKNMITGEQKALTFDQILALFN
ncbi:histidine--tRNA ligase [Cytophagales bacterium LB-30]|uniref:Histidine--tRNA ligase n=1 Tax=Shiella aurantiaca TaxID=3058365 RepID=A0ABT8F206_9BACT|nr:histidine--tRNA ligase [Shiella aurantiaca]MDN4164408.1 histidine--tRNA ligase [Shiella aurantiaca]